MAALLHPFLAAFLAEWGDRTQLLAMMLALRYRNGAAVLSGIMIAAFASALASALAGQLLAEMINHRAITLMTALALLFAGVTALMPQRPPRLSARGGKSALLGSGLAFALLSFGDKTQFLAFAFAGRTHALWLPAIGTCAGVMLAITPAVLLGDKLPMVLPMRALRLGAALALLFAGAICGLVALALV